jgi:RNA polymerase sigma factor (sigma-70 family)
MDRESMEPLPSAEQHDGVLLAAFAGRRDEAAFAAVVRRHAGMVFRVCRALLGHTEDAEDAAQAVFLILARKAGRLRGEACAAPWLHHVAHGVAIDCLRARSARSAREQAVAREDRSDADDSPSPEAIAPTLHAALDGLPHKYRRAIVLFHLDGLSLERTAAALRCPAATAGTWLARGRTLLRERLQKQGVSLSIAGLGACLAAEVFAEAIPASFVGSTAKVALLCASGQGAAAGGLASVHAIAIARGALRALALSKAKVAATALLAAGLLGGGVAATKSRLSGVGGKPDTASIPQAAGGSASPVVTLVSPAESVRVGWPMHYGPGGNAVALRSGAKLVDDLSDVRLLWESEDKDFGRGKIGASPRALGDDPAGHAGSVAGPIVADGKVFFASFRPSGDVFAVNEDPGDGALEKWFQKNGRPYPKDRFLIAADDVVVAADFDTGKTLWKAVEEGQGLSRPALKRGGYGVAPAYHQGKVFSLGTTGRLRAYDAGSGRKIWETTIGTAAETLEAIKRRRLADQTVPPYDPAWLSSLVVAGGVLVVPLFDGSNMGLRGVDVETGATRWETPKVISQSTTPALVRTGGRAAPDESRRGESRDYLLAATSAGELRMIDPRNGKALWTIGGLDPNEFNLTPSGTHVLVNVGPRTPGPTRRYGLLGAYHFSPGGAERAWTMPDRDPYYFETWLNDGLHRKCVIRDGLVYTFSCPPGSTAADRSTAHFCILREETGEVLVDTLEGPNRGMLMLVEDRLLSVPYAAAGDALRLDLYTADPRDFRKLSGPWKPPHTSTTGFEVFAEIPYVDGRILLRDEPGAIRCYDLRKRT